MVGSSGAVRSGGPFLNVEDPKQIPVSLQLSSEWLLSRLSNVFFWSPCFSADRPISPKALGLDPLGVTIYGQLHRHPGTTLGLGSALARSGRHARCSQPKRAEGSCNAFCTRCGLFLLGLLHLVQLQLDFGVALRNNTGREGNDIGRNAFLLLLPFSPFYFLL